MDTFRIQLKPFQEQMFEYVTQRADIFSGDIKMFNSPLDHEADPENTISLFEALSDDKIQNDDRFKAAFKSFYVELTNEVIATILFEYFYSLPKGFDNKFYALAIAAINPCRQSDTKTWDRICHLSGRRNSGHVAVGVRSEDVRYIFNDLFLDYFQTIRRILPTNEWRTVDFKVVDNDMFITFGEDLRIMLFEKEHGDEQWDGDFHAPTGEIIS